MEVLLPPGWGRPRGYSAGIAADGRQVFVAGQVGSTPAQEIESDDFIAQVRQALLHVVAVLSAGGAGPGNIVRMNWYVTDIDEYLGRVTEVGQAYREVIGKIFPAMTLLGVAALADRRAKVAIDATAVVPSD